MDDETIYDIQRKPGLPVSHGCSLLHASLPFPWSYPTGWWSGWFCRWRPRYGLMWLGSRWKWRFCRQWWRRVWWEFRKGTLPRDWLWWGGQRLTGGLAWWPPQRRMMAQVRISSQGEAPMIGMMAALIALQSWPVDKKHHFPSCIQDHHYRPGDSDQSQSHTRLRQCWTCH